MKKIWMICGLCLIAVLFMADSDCDDHSNTTDRQMATKQEQVQAQEAAQVGLPGVTNFTEAKLVRKLYELRDSNIATYSYVPDLEGRLWHLCDSIGYGLPYGVQFSNPEKIAYTSTNVGVLALPQAEPNGLFMPPSAEGTWVICAGPKGEPTPVYVEPRVIVSPFKLKAYGEYQP